MTLVQCTASPHTILLKMTANLNVCGVWRAGVADDTAALQACVDKVAVMGGRVILPTGTVTKGHGNQGGRHRGGGGCHPSDGPLPP